MLCHRVQLVPAGMTKPHNGTRHLTGVELVKIRCGVVEVLHLAKAFTFSLGQKVSGNLQLADQLLGQREPLQIINVTESHTLSVMSPV